MKYTKISPLGERKGPGTYEGIFNKESYKTVEEALAADDIVVVDFVKDEAGVIYFQFRYTRRPERMQYYRLGWQHFPRGVDNRDDEAMIEIAGEMLSEGHWGQSQEAFEEWMEYVRFQKSKIQPEDGQWRCPKCGSKDLVKEDERDFILWGHMVARKCLTCGNQFINNQ